MEIENVFSSKITRSQNQQKNNLYELLYKTPVKPVEVSYTKDEAYDFRHKTEKYYISQKKSRFKVKTVGEIRKLFEQDVNSYLPNEIENQQNILLRKIREGSTNDETTRELAKNMLISDKPMSRTTWQMLTNINPERHTYNRQLVLWNGSYIQVNGSKGGEKKFICQYDLSRYKLHKKIAKKNNPLYKRNALLKKSLSIKFKPGPLRRKPNLDDSYQKYHVGKTELINVPKAGLDVYPSYGVSLESNVTKFINGFGNSNGGISRKWAEFAVSMLGVVKKRSVVPVDTNNCITFDLAYKYEQKRILMRCGVDNSINPVSIQDDETLNEMKNVLVNMSEIEDIMHKIVDSVEISLNQDKMYISEDEPRSIQEPPVNTVQYKDKLKRKYCELDRLDVTVIQIPGNTSKDEQRICHKEYCNLGCICASLECTQIIKTHCGLIECMFNCQCDFLKYNYLGSLPNQCSELIPGLLSLDTEINLKLAKEEKKFHQTVVVSGEKSVLLKAQKRNWKASKKYGDFYKNVNLKTPIESKQILSIVCIKLDVTNIEPWCMIHKLYKCFCKGKFKNTTVCDTLNDSAVSNTKLAVVDKENCNADITLDDRENADVPILRTTRNRRNSVKLFQHNNANIENKSFNSTEYTFHSNCARIDPYTGRKYSNNYYKETNNKILEMEKNDKYLLNKMKAIIINAEANEECDITNKITDHELESSVEILDNKSTDKLNSNMLHKTNLATWLEASYKLYKTRHERGKLILNAPKPGKLALYPWSFLLKRYKERKNMFLVTKQKPYRIFMAINTEDEVLKDCIFIDEIQFSNLHKFPLTVRNLLTNVTNLENVFYIMYGFSNSWELIGSVTKLSEPLSTKTVPNSDRESSIYQSISIQDFFITKNIREIQSDGVTDNDRTFSSPSPSVSINDTFNTKNISETESNVNNNQRKNSESACLNKSETSRWFVMNIVSDFTEIQFHNRGFFVKYDNILKAINVARKTGKTVRLSTQTCASKSTCPQFGMYAIPDCKGRYVFVGPYETNEPLGIETIKTSLDLKSKKRTRGIWITTDKLDNMKVIDNPLSFLPPNNIDYNVMVPIDTDSNIDDTKSTIHDNKKNETQNKSPMKAIKPITIRKTNGFYHLASNGVLKKVPLKDPKKLELSSTKNSLLLNTSDANLVNDFDKQNKEANSLTPNAYSPSNNNTEGHKQKRGMMILKPDEINKRMLEANLNKNNRNGLNNDQSESSIDIDVRNFLSAALPRKKEEYSPIVISDDSEINTDEDFSCDRKERDVWIQCTNISNFGYIKGRRSINNLLSFQIPGLKPSEFYHEEDAFTKINQVLARTIRIPKHISLDWKVIESEKRITNKKMLSVKYLNSGYVLTEEGLQPIVKWVNTSNSNSKKKRKARSRNQHFSQDSTNESNPSTSTCTSDETSVTLKDLEDKSVHLENEGVKLWNDALANKTNILTSLKSIPNEVKQEMTDTLQGIVMMAED